MSQTGPNQQISVFSKINNKTKKKKKCTAKIHLFSFENNNHRSSRPEVFFKKVVLRNFAKFTGKHLCQSLQLY